MHNKQITIGWNFDRKYKSKAEFLKVNAGSHPDEVLESEWEKHESKFLEKAEKPEAKSK